MTPKQYLQRIEKLDRLIQNKLEEASRLRDMITNISTYKNGVKAQIAGGQDKIGSAIARIVDLEREIDKLVDKYVDERDIIAGQIEQLEDPDMYHVLAARYINHKTFKEIAIEMDRHEDSIYKIHGKALQIFGRKFDIK